MNPANGVNITLSGFTFGRTNETPEDALNDLENIETILLKKIPFLAPKDEKPQDLNAGLVYRLVEIAKNDYELCINQSSGPSLNLARERFRKIEKAASAIIPPKFDFIHALNVAAENNDLDEFKRLLAQNSKTIKDDNLKLNQPLICTLADNFLVSYNSARYDFLLALAEANCLEEHYMIRIIGLSLHEKRTDALKLVNLNENISDDFKYFIALSAIENDNLSVFEAILAKHFDANKLPQGNDPMSSMALCVPVSWRALIDRDPIYFKKLVEKGLNVNEIYSNTTLLHEAVRDNNRTAISRLIMAGCDLDRKNTYGETALHIAVRGSTPATVRALLESGANPNVPDKAGNTVLALAEYRRGMSPLLAQFHQKEKHP